MFDSTALSSFGDLVTTKNTGLIVGIAVAACVATIWAKNRDGQQRIPGPPGLWVIGNAFDLPREKEWLMFDKWKRQYGPIVALNVMGQQIILLNSPEYIERLLEKRSAISSNRPYLTMSTEMVGFSQVAVAFDPGPKLRDTRKYFNRTIGGDHLHKYYSLMEEEWTRFLRRIVNTNGGEVLEKEMRRTAAAIVLRIAYAIPVETADNPYVQDAALALRHFSKTTRPGAYIVDVFPMLKYLPSWFPGAGFKGEARRMRADLMRASERPYEHVKGELESGIVKNSFSHDLLQEPDLDDYQRDLIKWSAVMMYLAGSDTVVSMVHTFFFAMALHPEVQRKAREEIISVLGPNVLPGLKDRPKLSYIDAILKETIRWNPIVPTGGPRVITQDEILDGHFIKKGTIVLANVWALMHDENYFSSPHDFIPERFAKSDDSKKATALLDPGSYIFGFGRRVCPGRAMAEAQGWLIMARTLATLQILKPLDANGQEKDPSIEFTSGSICHPMPFDCRIRPYDDNTESMLQV